MPKLAKKTRLGMLLALLVVVIFISLVGTSEKRILDWLMPTNGWVEFKVPDQAQQIQASATESQSALDLCNQGSRDWQKVTVKLTGLYGTPYLAQLKRIRAGQCEHIPFSDFAEPSWKRMQMPPNEAVTRVEVLVDNSGYTALKLQ